MKTLTETMRKKYASFSKGVIALAMIMASAILSAQETGGAVMLDPDFAAALSGTRRINRDGMIAAKLYSEVKGECLIVASESIRRYEGAYRLTGTMNAEGMTLTFYLFTGSEAVVRRAAVNSVFSFTGTLMAFTPVSTTRDWYILDVRLEDDISK